MKKMIECKTCGNQIASNAKVCPNCGGKNKKPIYKKWWFWTIFVVVAFSIIIPSDSQDTQNPSSTIETASNSTSIEKNEKTNETIKEIKSGEKIVTKDMEIAIKSVELTYDVLPDDTSGFYTHYEAESGKVYICVDADVTNNAKQNLPCDEIGKVIANYNDGYTYSGFVIVDDSSTGFTYANITNINPLETQGIKWLVECPQEVEESENPLFLQFTIKGEKYIYTIR